MIKANLSDKGLVIKILSHSFDDNLSVNYIVKQDNRRQQRIQALMDYAFDVCYNFGEVFLSDNRKACLLVLYPHLKLSVLKSAWLDFKLVIRAIGLKGIKKSIDREIKIRSKQPKHDIAYLWFIGVDPLYQHKEFGTTLLKQYITHANNKNLPIYLETSTLKNIPWYERCGFQIYDEVDLGYTLFFLKRNRDK